MFKIEDILTITGREQFCETALRLFRFQALRVPVYRDYLRFMGIDAASVNSIEGIPFMPIEFFKSHRVYCGTEPPDITFTSSSTTGLMPARHHIAMVSDYEKCFIRSFEMSYGDLRDVAFFGLLPNYMQRKGSSLIYMVDYMIRHSGAGGLFPDDDRGLLDAINRSTRTNILLGVSYALLDLADKHPPIVSGTIIMETGGMKGYREELSKQELHTLLCSGLGVSHIHSEYGMAELMSQAYSYGDGIFRTPPWMKVFIRDLNDPLDVGEEGSGGINIIDLANLYSCAFIQTQDAGRVYPDGSFSVLGRIDRSEIRGCNLLIQ